MKGGLRGRATRVALAVLAGAAGSAAAGELRIEPVGEQPEGEPRFIAFKVMADWLDGHIRVRFPENIYSDLGLHFLDNVAPGMKRVSEVKVPTWQTDPATGALFYAVRTDEGIHFRGRVEAGEAGIDMAFTVENRTGKATGIDSQVCFDLSPSPSFNRRVILDTTYAWIDGKYRSLNTTTSPKRETKFAKIGYNWLLLLYDEQPDDPMRRIEDECPWWIVDQEPDLPLIVRETADGKHLLAVTWEGDHVRRLMTNSNIPCLHADPLSCATLADGESYTWKGRIFLMANDPERLLHLYRVGS